MNFNGWTILLGIFLLFAGSYALISLFTFLFIKFAMKDKLKLKKFLALTIAAGAWVVSTLLSFMLVSVYGAFIFAIVSAVIIFSALYYISKRFLSIDGKPKIVYSLTLAILLNPVWLFQLGILT